MGFVERGVEILVGEEGGRWKGDLEGEVDVGRWKERGDGEGAV